MGKDLNREPYYNASVASQMEEMKAISVGFPAIHDLIHIKVSLNSLIIEELIILFRIQINL